MMDFKLGLEVYVCGVYVCWFNGDRFGVVEFMEDVVCVMGLCNEVVLIWLFLMFGCYWFEFGDFECFIVLVKCVFEFCL